MSSSQISPSVTIIVILLLIIVVRIRRVINGTRVSIARSVGYIIYYIGFASLFFAESYYEGVSPAYFAIYAGLLVAAAFVAFRVSRSMLVFWKGPDGSLYSKGALPIYLTYVAGLVLRIAIGIIFIGPNFLAGPVTALSGAALAATIATDVILAIGAGLLSGRNVQLITRARAIKSGRETVEPRAGPDSFR